MGWGGGKAMWRTGAKQALAGAFVESGALAALVAARRLAGGPRLHVIGFHRIVDDIAALGEEVIPALCITTRSFERLLDVARERFTVLALDEAVARLSSRGAPRDGRDLLAITFDDGYRDVYLRALPALRRRSLPATVFVPTGHVGSREPLLHDRLHALLFRCRARNLRLPASPAPRLLRRLLARCQSMLDERGPAATLDHLIETLPAQALRRLAGALEDLLGETVSLDEGARVMDADELRACADAGISLGAHTIDHVVLVHEPAARVRRELQRPRRDLEAIAARSCTSFAYCNGLWSPALLPLLRDAGYTVAVTTSDRPNRPDGEPLLLGRKILWEGHASGLGGRYSRALLTAHLHDLFGALRMVRAFDGRRAGIEERAAWRCSA